MTLNHLWPLEVDSQTQEPFLRLRKHRNIVLTPFRQDDAPHLVPIFNDPLICNWMRSPPFPFTLEDAEEWVERHAPKLDTILQELREAQGSGELKIVGGAPVGTIRELQENGTSVLIGHVRIARCFHGELMDRKIVDWEGAQDKMDANNSLNVGNPNILWSFADFLASSHHGQGIMTDAIETLLNDWAIPRMNVCKMLVGTFVGNQGSVRVFEKNGFTLTQTIDNHLTKKGKSFGINVLEWSRQPESPPSS